MRARALVLSVLSLQLLSVLVHACCLGLLDACVPMTSVFAALTCGYTPGGELCMDPTAEQEEVCGGCGLARSQGQSGKLCACVHQGGSFYHIIETLRGWKVPLSSHLQNFFF